MRKIKDDPGFCDGDCPHLKDGRCSKYDEQIEMVKSVVFGDEFPARCVECGVARKVELVKSSKYQELLRLAEELGVVVSVPVS